MFKRSLLALSTCLALPAFAHWQLNHEASNLHFVSTKNSQVSEVHRFDSLSGEVSQAGELRVSVPLSSVNTSVAIRDTRMQEMLFEVGKYPDATYRATIPDAMLKLKAGDSLQAKVDGILELHGQQAPLTFDILVSRLDERTMTVATVAPGLVEAESFNLKNGLNQLQSIAGLASITLTVPVTFAVTFEKQD